MFKIEINKLTLSELKRLRCDININIVHRTPKSNTTLINEWKQADKSRSVTFGFINDDEFESITCKLYIQSDSINKHFTCILALDDHSKCKKIVKDDVFGQAVKYLDIDNKHKPMKYIGFDYSNISTEKLEKFKIAIDKAISNKFEGSYSNKLKLWRNKDPSNRFINYNFHENTKFFNPTIICVLTITKGFDSEVYTSSLNMQNSKRAIQRKLKNITAQIALYESNLLKILDVSEVDINNVKLGASKISNSGATYIPILGSDGEPLKIKLGMSFKNS